MSLSSSALNNVVQKKVGWARPGFKGKGPISNPGKVAATIKGFAKQDGQGGCKKKK